MDDVISIAGDSYDYTHILETPFRNVRRLRIEHLTLPALKDELYVTVCLPDLRLEFPMFYDRRYQAFLTVQEYPLNVTDGHYHDFETPLASLHRLKIQFKNSDGAVVTPAMTHTSSMSFFVIFSLTYDPREEALPMQPSSEFRALRMFDYRFTQTDLTNYRMTFEFQESLKRVSKVRLLGLHVPPMAGRPTLDLELKELDLTFPVHYDYWHTPSDIVLLKATGLHALDVIPPSNASKWTLEVSVPGLHRVATDADTQGLFGLYALFEITYHPRATSDNYFLP